MKLDAELEKGIRELRELLDSEEGQTRIREAVLQGIEMSEFLEKARQVSPEMMQKPFDI